MAAGAAATCGGGLLSGACLGCMLLVDGDDGSLYKGGADKGVRFVLAMVFSYSRSWTEAGKK